jgi:hypothetical protein
MDKKRILQDKLRVAVNRALDDGLAPHEVRGAVIDVVRSLRNSRLRVTRSEADRAIDRAVSDLKAEAFPSRKKEH